MPSYDTRHFGTIHYQDDSVFEFPAGLPGFEQEKRFLPLEHGGSKPILYLQSLTRPELCFITLPAQLLVKDYRLSLSAEDLHALEFTPGHQPEIGTDALCLAVISVLEGKPATANLLAPLVVNLETRRGLQAIQEDSGYSHQHPLWEAA